MADMSQVNLERLRATDAMWEETKHPRADNGQFTSGSGGGGAKVTKATPGMTGGKFGTEKSRINEAIANNNRRAEATQAKIDAAFKNKDKVAFREAMQEKSQGATRGLENIKNIKKTFQAAGKTLAKARPKIQAMRQQAKAAQPAAKPQASHPMAKEVQRDIDYWHQMQYGGNPSEKQKQDTIESMRMQYDSYLKTAEKNWKLAQSVPDLDEATRNKYKQKYETAKGKVEALKQMTEKPAQPAQGTGWNRKRTIEFLNKEVLPQLKPGENFEHADIPNMISMVEKFRRENNATELHPKVENGFLSINGIKVGRIASTAPKGNYGGGYSPGTARAEGRILARQEEDV